MAVSVVVPTYNEAANVAPLVEAVHAALGDRLAELVVVDDGSPDGTADVVRGLQGDYDGLRLLEREEREGLGAAYKHAFRQIDADTVVQMDADFSHPPDRLPALVDAVETGADVAVGSRYVDGGDRQDPLHRRVFPLIGSYLYRAVLGSPVRDVTSGFKAYDGAVLDELALDGLPDGFHFQAASLLALVDAGADVVEVPIAFRPRRAGEPKYGVGDLWDNFMLFVSLAARRLGGGRR